MATMTGMDVLQQWMQSARSAVPGMQAWASPSLDPEELGKRIEELRTVQFWLEQNAKLIASSIQALEVQRMTLATLQSLKVPLADIGAAFKMPQAEPASVRPEPEPEPEAAVPASAPPAAAPGGAAPSDPTQWWGNLAQQFSVLASQAMKDSAAVAQQATDSVAAAAAGAAAQAPAPHAARPRTQAKAAPQSGAKPGSKAAKKPASKP